MPTKAECLELQSATQVLWTTVGGVLGGEVSPGTGIFGYIFLPAAGGYSDGVPYNIGAFGAYWSAEYGSAYVGGFMRVSDAAWYVEVLLVSRSSAHPVRGVLLPS